MEVADVRRGRQVEDGVDDELSGAMVGDLSTAFRIEKGKGGGVEGKARVGGGGAGAEGVGWGMLDQEQDVGGGGRWGRRGQWEWMDGAGGDDGAHQIVGGLVGD